MGQKVNPIIIRLNKKTATSLNSCFYKSKKEYSLAIYEDYLIRDSINSLVNKSNLSSIKINRYTTSCTVSIYAKKPGLVIGKNGVYISKIKSKIHDIIIKNNKVSGYEIFVDVNEIKRPAIDANILASEIAVGLENRVSYKRAMKHAIQNAKKFGAKGIKISCSGRLNGAEIARTEWYKEGRIPLHTIRAKIDYAISRAETTYGTIGIKIWIFK